MSKKKKIPSSASPKNTANSKIPHAENVQNYDSFSPCWKIGNIDNEGKWGMMPLVSNFKFVYTEEILNIVYNLEDDKLHEVFNNNNNKEFPCMTDFWKKISNDYKEKIPIEIVKLIKTDIMESTFFKKILPKLKSFELSTWNEIEKATHDEGKSCNHRIKISSLEKVAKDRLAELKLDDNDSIFSLRIDNKKRVLGFRKFNYMDILWINLNHEVCLSDKKTHIKTICKKIPHTPPPKNLITQ